MSHDRAHIAAYGCLTALGDQRATHAALLRKEVALRATPVLGKDGGDLVPLALHEARALDEATPPGWFSAAKGLLSPLKDQGWGSARRPILITGSNFGVGSLHAFRRHGTIAQLEYGSPRHCVEALRKETGWGANISVYSLACVSAHLGLLQAARLVRSKLAESVLVFSFDFISPFVAGGFHALKILNGEFPRPYEDRPSGAIGLGDGVAYAVITREQGAFEIIEHSLHNEMHHFTSNRSDGSGFERCLAPIAAAAHGRNVWVKGHGTGTLEAGRMEAATVMKLFPQSPLVGWKGSIGHTLGSCGLVELSIMLEALRAGRVPGTVGTKAPTFQPNVALEPFDCGAADAAVCVSNAFGGAHAAFMISHA